MSGMDKSEAIKPEEDTDEYESAKYITYPKSMRFSHMPRYMRAAQFAPFAALSGHSEIMREFERITSKRKDIDAQKKEEINLRLLLAREKLSLGETVFVKLILFESDKRKNGGEYMEIEGYIQAIDENENTIVLGVDKVIAISDIIELAI